MPVVLSAGPVALRISGSGDDWASVTLEAPGISLRLGADTHSIVLRRLLEGLSSGLPADSKLEGLITFFEDHFTIFCGERDGQRVLVFQDADGQHRYQFCLEDRVLAAWLETLEHEVNKKTA